MMRVGGAVWLTRDEAARRVHRDPRTLARWIAAGRLTVILGLVCEDQLLHVERDCRRARAATLRRGQSRLS